MGADSEPQGGTVPSDREFGEHPPPDRGGEPRLTFSHLCERDIDLLLVEELRCSPSFQKWFVRELLHESHASSSLQVTITQVQHSVTKAGQGPGETDIRADFLLGMPTRHRIRAFIENKIDADFQPSQAERYAERAASARECRDWDRVVTVLLAPNEYLETHAETQLFDIIISYEDIIAYFARQELSDGVVTRSRHRLEMLEQAVYKSRRGYAPDIDETVTDFWNGYWKRSTEVAPSLRLTPPGPKPTRSGFVHFTKSLTAKPPLPRCSIKHKLSHGKVDLEIAGWADRLDEDRSMFESIAGASIAILRAGKSAAFSIEVPKLDTNAAFESQSELAEVGLLAALRLQEWFEKNSTDLQSFAAGKGEG